MRKEIDARGMKCPRPIIELALARRTLSAGDEISVVGDDPAFENDLKAWCDATNCELVESCREGPTVTAVIRLR